MVYSKPTGKDRDKPLHQCSDFMGRLHRVRSRQLKDSERHRRFAIQIGRDIVIFRSQFHATDIRQINDFPVVTAFDDDLAELVRSHQAALRINRQLQFCARRCRFRTQTPGRDLYVLRLDRQQRYRPSSGFEHTSCPDPARSACCIRARRKR